MKRVCCLLASAGLVLGGARITEAATLFVANMTTTQEPSIVGPTTTGGTSRPTPFGTATFLLNDGQTELSMIATVHDIDVTGTQTVDVNDNLRAAHIHASSNPAFTPPDTAGVVWGFFGLPFNDTVAPVTTLTPFATGVGGVFSGSWNLSEGQNTTLALQLPNIFAGRSYINFHTIQNPGGEIRGALTLVPEPASLWLLGTAAIGLLGVRARGRVAR